MDRYPERPSNAPAVIPVNDILVDGYRTYARRIRRMLYLGGVLQNSTHSIVHSYATGFLVILVCITQVTLILNFCRDYSDNLVIVSKCLGLASSFMTPLLMSCCFLVKREKLLELHKILNDIFEQELARDQKTKTVMLTSVYAFARRSYTLIFMLGFTVLGCLLPSIVNIIVRLFHPTIVTKFKWPFPVKFPWSVSNSGPFFYLLFLCQVFSSWWIVFTIGSVDALFSFYTFQISSILHAISARLTNPQPDEVFSVVLKTCTEIYCQLLHSARLLADVYGIIILRMVLTNAVLMCALIFEASHFTDIAVNQILTFIIFITMKLLQTFIYAWNGSLVTSASEQFRERIYFGKWLDHRLDCHVKAGVIMTMLQKPIIIKVLKVSSVNVNMFTNILNTTISYVFLLQSLDSE